MRSARHGEASIRIAAPPEKVWSLVSDVTRMGEWSPECYRVAWVGQSTNPPAPGSRFRGWNRYGPMRWSMTCEVKTVEPGEEISWSTIQKDRELVRWVYRCAPCDEGTELTESFDVMWLPPVARFAEDFAMRDRDRRRDAAMRTTLESIRTAAETQP